MTKAARTGNSTGETRAPTAVEATKAALDAIERWNGPTKAMITVTAEEALKTAAAIDARLARGEWCGHLAGMPISIKDNVDVAGTVTTAASKILANNMAKTDAFIVERLKRHGAVIVGKANLHEWVFGPTSQSTHYGPVRNPWDTRRIPGGSSGGSGASIAAGMCVASIGSDTGGSIRIPASFCGTVGLRPTIGRISCGGSVAVSAWFDTLGPLARRAADCARVFQVIAGYDPADPITEDVPVQDVLTGLDLPVKGLKIGIQRRWFMEGLDPAVDSAIGAALDAFKKLGVEIVDIDLGDVEKSHELMAFKVLLADAYNVHGPGMEANPERYGSDVLARGMLGKTVTGAEYAAGLRWRETFRRRLAKTFEKVDAIISPTTPLAAPIAEDNRHFFDKIREITRFTYAWSFPGVPALAVPCGFDAHGLPVSMQLAGRWYDEGTLLRLAHAFQKVTDHHMRVPTPA